MTTRRFRALQSVLGLALFIFGGCSGGNDSGDDGGGAGGSSSGSGGSSSGSGGASGTGGSGGGSTGCDFEPCGGDPIGSWVVQESCIDPSEDPFTDVPECAGALGPMIEVTGDLVFEDTDVTWNWVLVQGAVLEMDDACVSAIVEQSVDAVEVCPDLAGAFVSSGTFETASCEARTDTCRCAVTFPHEIDAGSDSYETAGDQVILGSGEVVDFCADGDNLSIRTGTSDGALTLTLARE